MKKILIAAALLTAAFGVCSAEGLTFKDMVPARGDKQVYSVIENTVMEFEGVGVRMESSSVGTSTSVCAAVSGRDAVSYIVLTTRTMKIKRTPGGEETTSSYSLDFCRAVPEGLFSDVNFQIENGEDRSVDVGNALMELKFPCAPGTVWQVGSLKFKDGFVMRPVSRAEGFEAVETPAGRFENCLKVVSECPNGVEGSVEQGGNSLEILRSRCEYITWYYPLIGIVKEVSRTEMSLRPRDLPGAAVLNMVTNSTTVLTEHKEAPRVASK